MKISNPYQLLGKWKRRSIAIGIVSGVLFIILLLVLWDSGFVDSTIASISGIIGLLSIAYLYRRTLPSLDDVLRIAHNQNPAIEFSGQLLLDNEKASGLRLLQQQKAADLFSSIDYKLPWNLNALRNTAFLIAGLSAGAVAFHSLLADTNAINIDPQEDVEAIAVMNEKVLNTIDTTFIKRLSITETPPSYTGLPTRNYYDSDIQVVEGAVVNWKVGMEGPIDQLYFRFSESDTLDVTRQLTIQKDFLNSDFYQYGFRSPSRNYVSDFHSVKVIQDQKPNILISGIEEYVRLPWQARHDLSFDISLTDDYELKEAFISATIAKGSGESVKFREREYKLKNYSEGSRTYKGSFSFQTDKLGMEPGDELYFYIKANDNYPYGEHWSKSVTHIISIADTTTYDYVEDGGMQVDLMPDFFRSQRQIIIESEQLLKDKPFVSIDSFNRASNELGFDQKMLRLKYGQFLGEENESGITFDNEMEEEEVDDHDHDLDHAAEGGISDRLEGARDVLSQYSHDHDHDHEEEEGQLLSTKGTESNENKDPSRPTWVEELSHNHDSMEEATFHDVSVKNKLRAALSVMWDAELHLRLYDPASSLKFQYESLALLQEIKNHARIYVHRIGFEPPTIKEGDIRLDGDQDKIDDRLNISSVVVDDEYLALKSIAESLGSNNLTQISNHLESALSSLAKIALHRPEVLPVLSLANNINRKLPEVTRLELASLRRWILKTIPEEPTPINGSNKFAHELTLDVAKKMIN